MNTSFSGENPIGMNPSGSIIEPENREKPSRFPPPNGSKFPVSNNSILEMDNKENNSNLINPAALKPSASSQSIELEKPTSFHDINDVPVGQKSKFILDEYPENFQMPTLESSKPLENESILPLPDRLKSKIWKTRQTALDELIKLFSACADPNDSVFSQYLEEFPKMVGDSNMVAQEKALEAFSVLTKQANLDTLKSFNRKEFMKIIVEKGYTTGKNNIKDHIINIFSFFFTKFDRKSVLEVILECFPHKNQKVVAGSCEILIKLILNFGVKKLDFLKDFYSEMEKLSNSSSSAIRAAVLDFYKEAYKWMGENMLLFTANIKKNIKQDLDKFIEEWPKNTIMTPLIASEIEENENPNGKSNKQGNNENDMFDILEGVDIFNKFNDPWCEKVLAQAKWSEKKELLDELIAAASVPKLQNTNYYPVLSMVKKILNDSNVNVMCCGIKILGLLAKSLRKSFNSSAKTFFPILVSKFKDKKSFVVEETHRSLENFLYCLSNIEEIQEDFKDAVHDKVLGTKINSLIWFEKFLEKLLKNSNNQKILSSIKGTALVIKGLLEDGSAEVRDFASKILGKVRGTFGKDFIPGFFNEIPQNRMQKILDAEEKFKAERGISTQTIPISQSSANIIAKPQENNSDEKAPKNIKKDTNKSNKTGNGQVLAPAWNDKTNKLKPENASEDFKFQKMSIETAESILRDNNLEAFLKALEASIPWMEKTEALKSISRDHLALIEENSQIFEAFLTVIKNRFKDWKESNLNLIKEFYCLLIVCAESQKNLISKKILCLLVPFFLEKMQDGNRYSESLWSFTQKILIYTHPKCLTIEFVNRYGEIIGNDVKKANPKSANELVGFIIKVTELVSLQNLPFKEIVDFAKLLTSSANPTIKQAATNLLKCMYSYLGQQLSLFLKDLSPSFLKTLQSEFQKVKLLEENDKKSKIPIFEENEKTLSKKPLDLLESLPRTDISNEVNKHLKKLSDNDWKVQKEGLDEIEKILTVNPRISTESLSDFNSCLKNGLKDKKNKSLLRVYINLTAKFAECCGREFFGYGKQLIHPLLSSLSDKQALVRCDVVNALHKMENALGPDFILNNIAVFLQNNENKDSQSVEMKQEILNWLLKNVTLLVKFPNLKALIPLFLSFLCDKNKEIRLLADQLNEKIVVSLGPAVFAESIKYLKSSTVSQIKPLFEKYCLMHKTSGNINGCIAIVPNTAEKEQQLQVQPLPSGQNIERIKGDNGFDAPKAKMEENKMNIIAKGAENQAKRVMSNKFGRMEQEKVHPWPVDTILDESIEKLKEDVIDVFSEAVGRKLFSFDPKRAMEGLLQLKQTVSPGMLMDGSDLVFKWVLFKLLNFVNDEIVEELLEFMLMTLKTFQQNQNNLFEFEARIILFSLKKVSERNNPQFKEKIDRINQIVGFLFNPDYVYHFWGFQPPITQKIPQRNIPEPLENDQDYDKKSKMRNSLATNMTLEGLNNYSIMGESPSPRLSSNITKKMILHNNLEVLNWSGIPGKIDALLNICNFLSEETTDYRKVIEEEATNIARTISALYRSENLDNQKAPEEFVNYLVKISLKIFRNKLLLDNIAYDVLMELIENILHRLLHEDAVKNDPKAPLNENKVSANKFSNDSPIKNLNSLMLKILETCSPNTIFQILFDLLIKHRKLSAFSKFIALVIKCILKLTKVMEALLPNLDLGKLFLKFHLYVCECFSDNSPKHNDDLGVKTIKTIINEIINIKGSSIMDYYHIISTHEKQDKYLYRWIEIMLSRQLSKDQKQSPLPNSEGNPLFASFQNKKIESERISLIFEKIKCSETFREGINDLNHAIKTDPTIKIQAFSSFLDPVMFERVKNTLDSLNNLNPE